MPLIKKILETNRQLVSLNLCTNPQITDKGAKLLEAAMKRNFFIKQLELDGTSISDVYKVRIEQYTFWDKFSLFGTNIRSIPSCSVFPWELQKFVAINTSIQKKLNSRLVNRNRNNVITFAKDGTPSLQSKLQSPEERAKHLEDACVKKIKIMGSDVAPIHRFLEDLQLRLQRAKADKLTAEDHEQLLTQSFMEKESTFLHEIRQLEELVVLFSQQKETFTEQIGLMKPRIVEEAELIADWNEKNEFFTNKMTDKIRSMDEKKGEAARKCTELQEEVYLKKTELRKLENENSRLRLYLNRCKEDIDRQFPKANLADFADTSEEVQQED